MPRIAFGLLAALAASSLAGCVPPPPPQTFAAPLRPAPGPVLVRYPPIPVERVEVIPPPPRGREVVRWQPGHWQWDGVRYDWVGGHYVERLVGVTRWVPGHWDARPGGYGWVPGRWV